MGSSPDPNGARADCQICEVGSRPRTPWCNLQSDRLNGKPQGDHRVNFRGLSLRDAAFGDEVRAFAFELRDAGRQVGNGGFGHGQLWRG